MKFQNPPYIPIVIVVLIICCINVVSAINTPVNQVISPVSKYYNDTIKISKLTAYQEKIKLVHKPSDNQIRIETDFAAADQLTAEIVNMIGATCQKTNFRVNTTVDYTLKPGIYFVVISFNKKRVFSSKIMVSQ